GGASGSSAVKTAVATSTRTVTIRSAASALRDVSVAKALPDTPAATSTLKVDHSAVMGVVQVDTIGAGGEVGSAVTGTGLAAAGARENGRGAGGMFVTYRTMPQDHVDSAVISLPF